MSLLRPTPASPRQLGAGLTVLRLITGLIFAAHGGQKLFVYGLDGVASGFAKMGLPLAGVLGPVVALVEFFGGLALVVGLLTRLASLGLALVMLGAILAVHLASGFFLPSGIEFALALLGASVLFALTGAGPVSLDALLAGRRRTAA